MRKYALIMFIFVFLLSNFTTTTFASSKDNNTGNINQAANTLANSKKLTKKDVTALANYHINSYLKTDIQTKGKTLTPSPNFIELYDTNDTIFAYIVPLIEQNKGEIGYITVGAIEDGYDAYEIVIDNARLEHIRGKLAEKDKKYLNNHSAEKAKLLYIPPMNYVVKVKSGNDYKYFDVSRDGSDLDVTEEVAEKKDKLDKGYNIVKSEENKKHIKKLLDMGSMSEPVMGLVYSSGATEDVRLVNEAQGRFVPVNDSGDISYGGNQEWWTKDITKSSRGCGPTAAANITYYLAKKNSERYGKLYTQMTISRSDFLAHMDVMYGYIKPWQLGEPSLFDWTADVERFASDRGVALTRVNNYALFTLDNTATYIKNGLNSDSPVACLNRQISGYVYGMHWMTITKYFKDPADNRWIAVSTWGERKSISYKVWFNSTDLWGGGLMYFK